MTGQGAKRKTRGDSRDVVFIASRGSKARESITQPNTRHKNCQSKRRVVIVGSINTEGHSKNGGTYNQSYTNLSIIWLTGHQLQNKDQNALTGNKRK